MRDERGGGWVYGVRTAGVRCFYAEVLVGARCTSRSIRPSLGAISHVPFSTWYFRPFGLR